MRSGILLVCVALWAIGAVAPAQVVTVDYNSGESEFFDASNNTRPTADALLGGGAYGPSFYVSTDVDYYHLRVNHVPSTLTVLVDGVGNVVLACDPVGWLEDSSGTVLVENDNIAYPDNLDSYFSYVFAVPGDYYVGTRVAVPADWNWNYSNYSIRGSYTYPDIDETPPVFGGATTAIRRSESGVTSHSVRVTWSAATDDRTPPQQIQYNIYYATSSTAAVVFAGAPAAICTGHLGGTVPGLSADPAVRYWFGVRAEDTAGNEDHNTRVIEAVFQAAVPPDCWPLYR